MEVPEVKAYSFSDWAALTPAKIDVPVPWSQTSLCVHHAGYMGTRGGVLVVRLGDGADAKSLCVKPFDKRLVNVDHELLAADILRAAGLRVPAARLASQAEIDDEMTPNLIAKFECTSGSWSMPDFLQHNGLYSLRADLRQKAGIPEDLAVAQQEALKVKRAERRAAIEARKARTDPVAVLEFVRGPTLLQSGSISALRESEFETLGLLAAFDVLFNNGDRLPVLFETEGNLGNVILEPASDGSVVCCAIDSCVTPLEGAALEKHLARLRAKAHDPDLTAAAAAFAMLGGVALAESQLDAIRRGWRRGIERISEMTQDGALQAALDARVDAAVAAGAAHGELSKVSAYLLTVARAIADLSGAADGVPPPQRPLPATTSSDAHPENRLSGASGLGTFLAEACSSLPADAVPLFAFDFDKTLTNGLATPGACLQARVRGGAHTLDGLRATAAVPHSRRCIITARADETGRISQGKLQQVLSQLNKAQPELLEFFEVEDSDESHRIVELVALSNVASENAPQPQGAPASPGASSDLPCAWRWRDVPRASWGPGMYATLQGDGRPILVGGAVYASGYSKPLALLHACTAESAPAPTHIFFIDDAPNNAYEVQRDLPGWLRQWSAQEKVGHDVPAAEPVLRSLWWDLFEEEFESKTIAPTTSGPDFACLRDGAHRDFLYGSALRHFGLSESDILERARQYEHVQRERDARQAAKVAALDISAKNAETPATSQPSVLDRRRTVEELLIAHGRAPSGRD
jgi:hypothetical protein